MAKENTVVGSMYYTQLGIFHVIRSVKTAYGKKLVTHEYRPKNIATLKRTHNRHLKLESLLFLNSVDSGEQNEN